MNLDETTLIEIQDYINALEEQVGLESETVKDIQRAISRYRTKRLLVASGLRCPSCYSENIHNRSGYDVCFDCGHHF